MAMSRSHEVEYCNLELRFDRRLIRIFIKTLFRKGFFYFFKNDKLAELMEKLIGDTRGHAVVKRFRDRQILIESIMFGEIIRMVEINGMEHKVLFQRDPVVTV